MRRIPTARLTTGDRLGRDVYANEEALPLLRAGVRMSDGFRQSLLRAGVTAVWIDDGISKGVEPIEVLSEATKRQAKAAIRDAFALVSHSLAYGGTLVLADTADEMRGVAELIVHDVTTNVHSAIALNDLANADGYTMKHSLAVTTLGLSLGARVMRKYGWVDGHGQQRFDGVEERLTTLGVGLLLHDIGKLAIPPDILQKPGPLTDDEWLIMRAHPALGFQILLKAHGISPLARAVVRSHHERWNGQGYPDQRPGERIHQFARIAAVADVFDALTSDRSYRHAMPTHAAYDFVVERGGSDFDPQVVEVFRSCVAPFPPGTGVVLSDGSCALVKEVHQDAVKSPLVRIIMDPSGAMVPPRDVDLARSPGLTITATDFEVPIVAPA